MSHFREHIQKSFPFLKGKKLLIAVSGGLDSMVLAELMLVGGYRIGIAHCNFQLRGRESDLDAEFVASWSKEHKIPFHHISFETAQIAQEKKQSIQVAARELRYQWFDQLQNTHGYDYLLTAHHADDNLETFLINLSRGTGLDGLLGIPLLQDRIVRPLLSFSRADLANYAKKQQLTWREDQSNQDTKYIRNQFRLDIIPLLKERHPEILHALEKTTGYLKQSQSLVKDAVEEARKKVVIEGSGLLTLSIKALLDYQHPEGYLYELLKPYGFSAWSDIYQLLEAQSGKVVYSANYRLLKDRDRLIVSERSDDSSESTAIPIEEGCSSIEAPIALSFEHISGLDSYDQNVVCLDSNRLSFPLTLRKWQQGDIFYPSGMGGKKKLSKFFKDEKYSLIDKESCWLLCSEDQIVWVVGKRADQRFVADANSKKILKIRYQNS